jgi:lipopolysaccharide heptosyltransferase II
MFGRKKENILVIKTDSLAGFVAAEPAFEAIRQAHPDAKISLLTISPLQRVARASPYFDQVAGIPNFRDGDARKEFIQQLKSAKFATVYDLASDEAAKKLYSAMGPFRPKWHCATPAPRRARKGQSASGLPSFEKMFSDAGVAAPSRSPDFNWALSARKDSANMKPAWYGISGAFGLFLPGDDEEKRWTASGYAGLASIMATTGFMPVLTGSKELHHFGDDVADQAPQLVDLTGKTDHLQLAALAHEAAFFVSDDAEEVDLAVSVGCQGVLIVNAKSPASVHDSRHVVTLTSDVGLGAVDAAFVWRTLSNMGLIATPDNALRSAAAR